MGVVADGGEGGLDECFGLGAGDEDASGDLEGQAEAFAAAEDVGERLMGEAAAEERLEAVEGGRGGLLGAGGEDVGAVEAGGLGVEEFGLEAGFIEGVGAVGLEEAAGGLVEEVAEGGHVAV